jgi:hypothetical protein
MNMDDIIGNQKSYKDGILAGKSNNDIPVLVCTQTIFADMNDHSWLREVQ